MNASYSLEVKASTPMQRELIRMLMIRNELSIRKTTLMHHIPFRAAKLSEPPADRPLDPILKALTMSQASALIDALKNQLGIEDDDDDS